MKTLALLSTLLALGQYSLGYTKDPGETSINQGYEFQDWEYAQIRDVSLAIIDGKSSQSHVVVGVGRSPTPFTAFIQNIDSNLAINLPLSHFGLMSPGSIFFDESSSQVEQDLFRHFDRFLLPLLIKGKKLIIVDFVSRGKTFEAIKHHFEKYVRERGKAGSLEYCFLGSSEDFLRLKKSYSNGQHRFISTPFDMYGDSLTKLLAGKNYGPFAEYGEYDATGVFNPSSTLSQVPRPEYKQFKEKLMLKMAKDHLLEDRLGGLNGGKSCGEELLRQKLSTYLKEN